MSLEEPQHVFFGLFESIPLTLVNWHIKLWFHSVPSCRVIEKAIIEMSVRPTCIT